MSKTEQTNDPAFVTIKHKKGSEPFGLYVTNTAEGPLYDAVGIDAEQDEFEIQIDDGCARLLVDKLKYLVLNPDALQQMADLVEAAEEHYESWLETEMGRDHAAEANEPPERKGGFATKYMDVLGIRSRV
ncbi:hypothetical protein AB9K41_09000, partial [Cribrihabitans sp. XS_ASV171]